MTIITPYYTIKKESDFIEVHGVGSKPISFPIDTIGVEPIEKSPCFAFYHLISNNISAMIFLIIGCFIYSYVNFIAGIVILALVCLRGTMNTVLILVLYYYFRPNIKIYDSDHSIKLTLSDDQLEELYEMIGDR